MHILDLIIYIVLSILYWLVCPEEYKYELGFLAGLFYFIIFTIIYATLFIFFFDWIDIFKHMTLPSITW